MKFVIKPHTETTYKIDILNDDCRSIYKDNGVIYNSIDEAKAEIKRYCRANNLVEDPEQIEFTVYKLTISNGYIYKPLSTYNPFKRMVK